MRVLGLDVVDGGAGVHVLAGRRMADPIAPVPGDELELHAGCVVAERTFEQLAAFGARYPVLMLDPAAGLGPEEALAARALSRAGEHTGRRPFAIAVSCRASEVAALQARVGRCAAAHLGVRILGLAAVGLYGAGLRKLAVAVGETSGAVLEALGTKVLDVAPYDGPGISRAAEAGPDPTVFCLKSGKLGAVDMLESVLRML
jgi:uncharacterized protein YgbK (DUF1537 family)